MSGNPPSVSQGDPMPKRAHLPVLVDEVVAALAKGLGGGAALFFHQFVQALAQGRIADAQEAPGLHQPDAGRLVRSAQQTGQLFGRHLATAEMAHVAALGDGSVDGGLFGGGIGCRGHGLSIAAAAAGADGI